MTAISESFYPVAQRGSPRLLEWARWAVLGVAFIVSGMVLGVVAVLRPSRLS